MPSLTIGARETYSRRRRTGNYLKLYELWYNWCELYELWYNWCELYELWRLVSEGGGSVASNNLLITVPNYRIVLLKIITTIENKGRNTTLLSQNQNQT
jgi:hypothetical protein